MREIFSNPIPFIEINKYAKCAVLQISTVLLLAHHAGCQSVLWNRIFLDIYLKSSFAVRNLGNKSAMRFFFFGKCSKFNVDFKNAKKNWEKISIFWDNRIWNGCCKLSLLRRAYLSRQVNALRNSFKTLHISKRDFLQRNCLHNDQ